LEHDLVGELISVGHGNLFKPEHSRQIKKGQNLLNMGIAEQRRGSGDGCQGSQKRPDPVKGV
jgi:hypothetical protein